MITWALLGAEGETVRAERLNVRAIPDVVFLWMFFCTPFTVASFNMIPVDGNVVTAIADGNREAGEVKGQT